MGDESVGDEDDIDLAGDRYSPVGGRDDNDNGTRLRSQTRRQKDQPPTDADVLPDPPGTASSLERLNRLLNDNASDSFHVAGDALDMFSVSSLSPLVDIDTNPIDQQPVTAEVSRAVFDTPSRMLDLPQHRPIAAVPGEGQAAVVTVVRTLQEEIARLEGEKAAAVKRTGELEAENETYRQLLYREQVANQETGARGKRGGAAGDGKAEGDDDDDGPIGVMERMSEYLWLCASGLSESKAIVADSFLPPSQNSNPLLRTSAPATISSSAIASTFATSTANRRMSAMKPCALSRRRGASLMKYAGGWVRTAERQGQGRGSRRRDRDCNSGSGQRGERRVIVDRVTGGRRRRKRELMRGTIQQRAFQKALLKYVRNAKWNMLRNYSSSCLLVETKCCLNSARILIDYSHLPPLFLARFGIASRRRSSDFKRRYGKSGCCGYCTRRYCRFIGYQPRC